MVLGIIGLESLDYFVKGVNTINTVSKQPPCYRFQIITRQDGRIGTLDFKQRTRLCRQLQRTIRRTNG